MLPDGCVDILFSTRKGEPLDLSVVGLMTTARAVSVPAGQSFFGVRFRPGMAAAFIEQPAFFQDKVELLENVWGATARSIHEQLAGSSTPEEMTVVMESFLRPIDPPDAVQRALFHLSTTKASLDRVASDSALSTRTLRRACAEYAGVSPAYLRRILRFREATDSIRAAARSGFQPSWAQLAVGCGYYDQAHFIREFQEFSGSTPGRFLQYQPRPSSLESGNDERTKNRKSNRLR